MDKHDGTVSPNADVKVPVSAFAGVFIISNAALGVGTLNFPEAFASSGGLTLSIPILVFCALMCALALSVCAFANYETKTEEYFEAVRFYCGSSFELLYHFALVITNLGTCVMYMITVGDQSDEVLARIFGESDYCENWYLQRTFTICLCSCVVILPLCLAKSLDFLKYPSMLAVFSMLYLMLIIVVDYFTSSKSERAEDVETLPENFVDLFYAFPTLLLGYQCMTNAYPVFGCFRNPSMLQYASSIVGSVLIMTSVYLPVGMFGYLKNGIDVNGNILLDYDASENMILVAQVAVLIAVMMSYPTVYSVARGSIDKMWKSSRSRLDTTYESEAHTTLRRYLIALVYFGVSLAIAVGLPGISVAVSFTGSMSAFFYLIYPGLFLIQTTYVDENGQFTYSKKIPLYPPRSSAQYHKKKTPTDEDKDAETDLERSADQIRVTREEVEDERVVEDDSRTLEHQATQSYQQSKSLFITHKYRNGILSWVLRLIGTFLCSLGVFVLGLGFAHAFQTMNQSEPSNIDCS